jgi:hypothetical protein
MKGSRTRPAGRKAEHRRRPRPALSKVKLEAMIEEATVEFYNDDLPLPSPRPAGAEWIEAYRRWSGGR